MAPVDSPEVLAPRRVVRVARALEERRRLVEILLHAAGEGTLGVFTDVTLRLVPKPPEVATVLALFDDAHVGERVALTD